MKTLILIASLVFVAFLGCEKEYLHEDDQLAIEMNHYKGPNHGPRMLIFKGKFTQFVNPEDGFIVCDEVMVPFPKIIHFEGNATHLGKTYGEAEVVTCGPGEVPYSLTGEVKGFFIAANGDTLRFVGHATSFPDNTGTGEYDFDGGSGRFENACGNFRLTSQVVDNVNHAEARGKISCLWDRLKVW
jgi:hypothetical protein